MSVEGKLDADSGRIWISSQTGRPAANATVSRRVRQGTDAELGIEVGPHMFRTAAATTAAILAPDLPGLASGVLGHADKRVTERHYSRAKAHEAGQALPDVLGSL